MQSLQSDAHNIWILPHCLHIFVFQFDRENMIFGIIPKLQFKDKDTYTESSTKHYDLVSIYDRYGLWIC